MLKKIHFADKQDIGKLSSARRTQLCNSPEDGNGVGVAQEKWSLGRWWVWVVAIGFLILYRSIDAFVV